VSAFKAITRSAGALKPFVKAIRGVDEVARESGALAVLDGDPVATARLREILGVDSDEPLRDATGALLHVAVPDHNPTLAAAVLAGAKREGRPVLVVIAGPAGKRAKVERRILEARPLEPSNVAHVANLDDPAPVLANVARFLDEGAIPAARRYPALRDPVAEEIIGRASRQAGAIGVAALVPGADLPVIALIQVRLVAQLAALHNRPLDARRGLELAGVVLSAFGWRALARRAVRTLPVARFAVRGGVAYSATRAVGEAARTWFTQAGDRADQPLDGLNKAVAGALSRRGSRR
jgi:uncharacterized protein (DUF697 family)